MTDDFQDFFDNDVETWDESDEPASMQPPKPPRSRKEMRENRRKQQTHRWIKIIVCIVVLALIVVGIVFSFNKVKDWKNRRQAQDTSIVEDYPGPGNGDVSFTVESGEGVLQIAQHLQEEDIIKSVDAFSSVVAANNMTLYPGTYALKYQMKVSEVAKILSDQGNARGFVEVRQGEGVAEVLQRAATATDQDLELYTKAVQDADIIKRILPAEANGSFEGWLEPGVYNVMKDKNPEAMLKEMVDARIAALDELNVPQGKDRERILIIASIVEAEVNKSEYYGKVSRVIQNRLDQNMPLGMDSTVAYGVHSDGLSLTNEQLADESNPYNTRIHTGLPPTPINNPGAEAIEAAMHPEEGNWLYFVTVNLETGETKFTDNYDQFEQYAQEYKEYEQEYRARQDQ